MNPFIKKLDSKTFDVFFGNGYDGWTRVRRFHWGIKPVGGRHINRQQIHILNSLLVN